MSTRPSHLIIFNFEMDEDSPVLSFAVDWVNQIAENFHHVSVFTLRTGKYHVSKNVTVYSLEREKQGRLKALILLYKKLIKLHLQEKTNGYFVHMAQAFVPLLWPIAKFFRQPILLWYAHKSTAHTIKLSSLLADKIFTVSKQSFRLKRSNVEFVGHGINETTFPMRTKHAYPIKQLLLPGRITPIKNVDLVADTFSQVQKSFPDIQLHIVGTPVTTEDQMYWNRIQQRFEKLFKDGSIQVHQNISHKKMSQFYQNSDLVIDLSPGALDKVILEAWASNVPVLTNNDSACEIFKAYQGKGLFICDKSNFKQKLSELLQSQTSIPMNELREEVIKHYSLQSLAKKISQFFIA